MRSFKKVFKPLLATAVIGAGGYYIYDTYRVRDLEKLQAKPIIQPETLQTNIPSLIQHQEHQHHTRHEQEELQMQKSESLQNSQPQKTVEPQFQESNKQTPTQNSQTSQGETQKVSEQVHRQPQKIQEPVEKTEDLIPKPKEATSKQQKLIQKPSEPISQTQETVTKEQQVQQKPIETKVLVEISKIKRLSQLSDLPIKPKEQLKTVLVVVDMGYTHQFEQKLLQTIKNIKKIPNSESIQVYRVNSSKPQDLEQLSKAYGHKIKEETIFLLKNQLDNNFIDINFDMYMQYPTMINTYLTKMNLYNSNNEQDYLRKIEKMSPNESYLMFIYDETESEEKRQKALLAAKYIEMELALHHLDHGVKVVPVEASVVKDNKIIPEDKIRSKSIHIIRKQNEFTHVPANLFLKFDDEITPYHLLADIGLHNKRGEVAIQQYLQKIETFNSLSMSTPYLLSLTIDKNRISTENYKILMDTFKQIKRKNRFPEVSIGLKFAQVGYLGKNEPDNAEFCIKMANVAELQNQSAIHEMTNIQDAKNMGITEQNWLKNSNEYLYPHQVVSEELIGDFVGKVLTEEIPQYYRSDKPSSIQNVHKIVASNFDKQILQNNSDHFVFQYSDHCPSCKLISPLIAYMNDLLQPIPLEQRFDIHVMNCHKNRVRNQVYSPYTPNMHYFKNEWKHAGPVRIGLETIKYGGLEGLYNFCVITNMVKTIDGKKFNEAIESAKGWNKAEFIL